VRKLAEVGLLTARKSVSVPGSLAGWVVVRDWGAALFRGLCQESYYFALRWWHNAGKQGPRKLIAWVDIVVFSSVRVRSRQGAGGPWRRQLFRGGLDDKASVGRMRLRRRSENKS
jgi:hypothetical protein